MLIQSLKRVCNARIHNTHKTIALAIADYALNQSIQQINQ